VWLELVPRKTGNSSSSRQGWKKPVFKKKPAHWFYLGFFGFFLYIFREERVFRVFSVSRILLGESRL
jgi:hypothetical protein